MNNATTKTVGEMIRTAIAGIERVHYNGQHVVSFGGDTFTATKATALQVEAALRATGRQFRYSRIRMTESRGYAASFRLVLTDDEETRVLLGSTL